MRLIGRLSISAETTNSTIVFEQELRVEGDSNIGSKRRTELVVYQSIFVKRSLSSLFTSTTSDSLGCISSELGSLLQRPKDRRSVVIPEKRIAYKCPGTEGCQTSNYIISPFVSGFSIYSHSNGQYCSLDLSNKDGRDSKRGINSCKQRDLKTSFRPSDHDYRGVLARCSQCGSEHNVTICEKLERMDVKYKYIPSVMQSQGNSMHRSICLQINSPSSSLLCLENRLIQQESRYFSSMLGRGWTHLRGYAFPLFYLIGKALWKVQADCATILIITSPGRPRHGINSYLTYQFQIQYFYHRLQTC